MNTMTKALLTALALWGAAAETPADNGHRAWLTHGAPTGWMDTKPAFERRILNHWDNLNGSVERGYAGRSIFWEEGRNNAAGVTDSDRRLWREYGELCQSVGINGSVLNNVNAKPAMLTDSVLARTKAIADALRPYGIQTYLSINFASPKALGELPTGDPLDKDVQEWWRAKVAHIYKLIPDFGGFLVKANSEGEPGPMDYGRTHADGANMLAAALKPHGGIVMWRAFVYSAGDPDRAKQAYAEFMPLDGQFADNVIVQVKNGPIDFQPCEPYSPLFTSLRKTRVMPELQITMEYLGQERWLTFLAPQWHRFFSESRFQGASPLGTSCIAAVANIGNDEDWCGSIFNQANLYAFARYAWNPRVSPGEVADDWLEGTFGTKRLSPSGEEEPSLADVRAMMLASWHNTVDAMMPLGLHHIFAGEHHYGPEPWYAPDGCRPDWTPPYYHKADGQGIGFDRTQRSGTAATAQYPDDFAMMVERAETCPADYLLWFHHLPWSYRMPSGRTLWEDLCARYDRGLKAIRAYQDTWQSATTIDSEMHAAVLQRLRQQLHDATVWHDACILYFQSINHLPIPYGIEPPQYDLNDLKRDTQQFRHLRWKDSK